MNYGEPTTPLPPGRTCADCIAFGLCEVLISRRGTETECDWNPSRFGELVAKVEQEPKEEKR